MQIVQAAGIDLEEGTPPVRSGEEPGLVHTSNWSRSEAKLRRPTPIDLIQHTLREIPLRTTLIHSGGTLPLPNLMAAQDDLARRRDP
ncbi:hypothetical protein GCM10009743_46660 [Kribbella swartbergensis]